MRRVLQFSWAWLLLVLSITSGAAAPRVLDQAEVRVIARIPPLVLVEITRGHELTVEYDGSSEVIHLPEALGLHVTANAPWQAEAMSPSPFGLLVKPAGSADAPARALVAGAGQYTIRWDVLVQVPPGTPAGRYQVPVTVLVSAAGATG